MGRFWQRAKELEFWRFLWAQNAPPETERDLTDASAKEDFKRTTTLPIAGFVRPN